MTTITLPDGLPIENSKLIQVFDYQSTQEISKQEIILNQNTFSFLLDGTKEVFFDNSTLSIENSEFLIMKSGHCLMTEKLSEVKNYRSLLLFFSNKTLLNFIHKNNLAAKKSSEYKSVYSFKYDNFIRSFVKNLEDISKLSDPVKNKLLQLKLEEILVYLIEIYGTDFLFSLTINSDNTTQKFTQTIESNKLNKLTLKELAFLCNMSVSTFKREFEKHYAESPIKWFQNKRLEHANYLLHKELKTPSEMYFEVGYESLSSFIQAYKSKYGITPKQHQNN
ncbi:AraC family transcriptional regulator [uncultured Tenacibaculum sp.]|uniref:helix-turn-helix domain-containing protein n=1 Tax=uncultured Tenacibaculum sp. TaxID=174713 RepID=UPI0026093DD5|nr:AraC family transcriptional regulator [uncultured Tenacibaculum sp.]